MEITDNLVSIGIPVYNRSKLMLETINSALNQSYTNIEVIVCDNCSTDNTWEVLNTLRKSNNTLKIFKNEANLGAVKNWQNVFNQSKGEYFLMLWSDDVIDSSFIDKAIKLFDNETAFVIVGNAEFDYNGIINKKLYPFTEIESYKFIEDIILENKNSFLPSPAIALFRKNDLNDCIDYKIPNLDNIDFNKTGAGPDVLFFLNVAKKYKKIKFINEVLLYNRVHETSITSLENKKGGLKLSYDWAKYHFVKTKYPDLLKKYKTITILRYFIYNKIHKNLLISLKNEGFDIFYLIKLFFYFIKSKL